MNIDFRNESKDILLNHINRLTNLKPVLSNYFISDLSEVESFITSKSVLLRKNCKSFYRIYVVTTDIVEIAELLANLSGENSINIPTKGEIDIWKKVLLPSGYNLIGIYERFYNPNTTSTESFSANYANLSHLNVIKSMMYGYFNPITDWLPDEYKLSQMILNNQVIINEKCNELCGFFIFTFEGKKCYFNCWYDTGGDGIYLLYNVYALMKIKDIVYSYFWINSANEYVKKIHILHGSRPDGLKDFTFLKRN